MNPRGERAEALAADFLRRAGLHIAGRNYRCRFGEIDLIARDGATVVFVEVRHRASGAYGGAAASITPVPPCRFDAVLITGEPPRIEWLRNAIEE